jgi:hypothetical protein
MKSSTWYINAKFHELNYVHLNLKLMHRFEVTLGIMKIVIFLNVTTCGPVAPVDLLLGLLFDSDDGGNMFFRNIGKPPSDSMTAQPRM